MTSKNGNLIVTVTDENGEFVNVRTNPNTDNSELLVNLQSHQCTDNTTTIPLSADGVYIGANWQDMLDYGVLTIGIVSDADSAVDGLEIQWSQDGINAIDYDKFTVVGGIAKTFTFGPAHRYYRVKYTNGSEAQSNFQLTSIIRRTYVKPSSHRIADSIVSDDDAELTKAVITGLRPDGVFDNANLTQQSNLKVSLDEYGDTPSIDAFDRLRVSNPYTLFDSKQLHDKQPLFWDEALNGTSTSVHLSADACTEMSVSTTGDYVIRQTKQRFNYQPAKSQLCLFTFHTEVDSGVRKRVGQFTNDGGAYTDAFNGIFFEISGSNVSWNIAKNGSITESVLQADWNYDTMDGTGPSLQTLDLDAPQIGIIDYEWLGIGRVRVGFVIDGLIRYVHYFNHANDASFDSVYMSTPNLPMRYEIYSYGGAGTMDHICSSVISEGGVEENGVLRGVYNSSAVSSLLTGNTYAIIGIKLKNAYKDVTVTPTAISMLCTTNDSYRWSLRLNPTVAGTFTYSDVDNSAIQRALGTASNTVSGGIEIGVGFANQIVPSNISLETALRMGSNIDGTLDSLVLCITPITNNMTVYGSLSFRELL